MWGQTRAWSQNSKERSGEEDGHAHVQVSVQAQEITEHPVFPFWLTLRPWKQGVKAKAES